jgi:hypothetical protein
VCRVQLISQQLISLSVCSLSVGSFSVDQSFSGQSSVGRVQLISQQCAVFSGQLISQQSFSGQWVGFTLLSTHSDNYRDTFTLKLSSGSRSLHDFEGDIPAVALGDGEVDPDHGELFEEGDLIVATHVVYFSEACVFS